MSTELGQLERRAAQRFELPLPVTLHRVGSQDYGSGLTQNISVKGAFICTDLPLSEADKVELTLVLPSEITLTNSMRVRCQGKVVRVRSSKSDAKYATAILLEKYDFLPEAEGVPVFEQISPVRDCRPEPEVTAT